MSDPVQPLKLVTVNAAALAQVLNALNGPGHLIRELQATRRLPGNMNPINRLIDDYNDDLLAHNAGELRPGDQAAAQELLDALNELEADAGQASQQQQDPQVFDQTWVARAAVIIGKHRKGLAGSQ